jgi:sulfite reductase (NADPH) flavoprotein alpha-component
MTISVWRYSHLALAVSSFLFLILASVTGIILAFEPIGQKLSDYRVKNFDQITVAQAVTTLKKTYPGITDITVDVNGFVTVKGTDASGKQLLACVDAHTGKILGAPYQQNNFFQWVTALHRSLFLHEAGRIFVGLIAFLLFLIAVSGTVLVIQRQRGVKRFFNRIVNENFSQYWHVVLGRLSLIPIIIIALSGTYLSVSRFSFFPDKKIKHQVDIDHMKTGPQVKPAQFVIFKNTPLANVRTIQFPFSDFPEDYFTLKLKDREMVVNQFTGDVLSNIQYAQTTVWLNLSLNLHTGRASIIWALVLAVASANIMFFIWSGLAITLKRRSGRSKNKFKADDSDIIILVGSENGSTNRYAGAVYSQLIKQGKRAFITELNNYTTYPQAQLLLVLTATYGTGDAPSNAGKFAELLAKHPQQQAIKYSVVGFGSHGYPDFCQFAFEVNQLLQQTDWAGPLIDIHTVDDKSPADFSLWAEAWSQQSGIALQLPPNLSSPPQGLEQLSIVSNTRTSGGSQTFLLRLKPKAKRKVKSGDLLAIYPANDHRERLYSIGVIDGLVQLSVRLHPMGLGSAWLHGLRDGQKIKARIVDNPHFHFPHQAAKVIMIANGTGIAPFLGMVNENTGKIPSTLYCGFREVSSYQPYSAFLEKEQAVGKLDKINLALSREGEKQYVSDLLAADARFIAETLEGSGIIMLCGSLAMQKDVLRLFDSICAAHCKHELSWYQSHAQILMDCY